MWSYFQALYYFPLICVSVLCHYYAILIAIALQYSLKSERMISSQACFGNLGSLCFPMNFRVISSSSVINVMGILKWITLSLQIALGSMGTLTILILSIQNMGWLSIYLYHLQFPSSVFQFSEYKSFTSLPRFFPGFLFMLI